MRLRAAVPALICLSLLTAIPTAHASGCGTSSDAAGDVPDPTLDIVSAKVAVVKIPRKPKAAPNLEITLTVGSTDTKNSNVVNNAGASYYVDFLIKGRAYSFWRHVAPAGTGPDVFGGRGVMPTYRMTGNSVTWILPIGKVAGIKSGSDACSLRGYVQMVNGIATVDSTA
jgi:hypothetical protein